MKRKIGNRSFSVRKMRGTLISNFASRPLNCEWCFWLSHQSVPSMYGYHSPLIIRKLSMPLLR
jgi:hypothetical protein